MLQPRFAALVLAVAATIAACGSNDTDTASTSATADGDVVAVGAAPAPGDAVGSLGDAVEVAAESPGEATVAACTIDRQTLQTAVETYELLNGALPASQQELLDAEMIRELSVRFEVGADGVVVPAPGSPCT